MSRLPLICRFCLLIALAIILTVPVHRAQARSAPALAAGATTNQAEQPQSRPDGEIRLVIDTDKRTLTVLAGEEILNAYPVAIGKWSTPTPIGEWKIIDKGYNWGGPFGVRWLGLNILWGVYGIHGTNQPGSISYEASLGCLRMFNDDILQFFDLVKVGTQVDIIGSPHETNIWHRNLGTGSVGPDVVYAQLALKKKGFYPYRCDGVFGRLSDLGVRRFQVLEGLPVTGKVDKETNLRLLRQDPEHEDPDNKAREEDGTPGNGQTD